MLINYFLSNKTHEVYLKVFKNRFAQVKEDDRKGV